MTSPYSYDAANAIWAAADCDQDGVSNGEEEANGTDPYQVSGDTDGDGIDDDNEINDNTDPNDPCDRVPVTSPYSYDAANAIWAAADCDQDGVSNGEEEANGTDPYQVSGDTDGDGIDDDNEINDNTDPNDPCDPSQDLGYTGYDATNVIWAAADCDQDGVSNGEEEANGTDPYQVSGDTDGDGIDDDNEINDNTDPNDSCDPLPIAGYKDYDASNSTWSASDCDSDGVLNGDEHTNGTDPYSGSSQGDTDNDGIADGDDNCPSTYNPAQHDFDNDGIGDVCDTDIDNDGVPNESDLCGDTIAGIKVDVNGCEIFSLDSDNFNVRTVGVSCIGNHNGLVEVTVETPMNYTALLTNENGVEIGTENFTDSILFDGLSSGNYTLCIGVMGQADYQRCYTLNIAEPEPLTISSKLIVSKSRLDLEMSGSNLYTIEVNGSVFKSTQAKVSLLLDKIENSIKISTDLDCQGSYEDLIVLSPKVYISPNPVEESTDLKVYVGIEGNKEVRLTVFDTNGGHVMDKNKIADDDGFVNVDMSSLSKGMYFLTVLTDNSLTHHKIIKK